MRGLVLLFGITNCLMPASEAIQEVVLMGPEVVDLSIDVPR
jgi:hypothetical protein